jgi:prophage regulatory protein
MRDTFLRKKEVLAITSLSNTSLYYYERDGRFPRHLNIGPRCVAWLSSHVDLWMRDRYEGRPLQRGQYDNLPGLTQDLPPAVTSPQP